MAGTAYETPLYVIEGSGGGPVVLVLGGAHGDEPGGWMAAEALVKKPPHTRATLIVVPRANIQAVQAGVRSTPELGDLNRQYPGGANGLPMGQMAGAIVDVIRRYKVDVMVDLHESWDPYSADDDGDGGVDTAAIGQTISPHLSEPSRSIARAAVERANRSLSGRERFHYYEYPAGYVERVIVPPPEGLSDAAIPNNSSLYLPGVVPHLASITVEVSQQQSLKRRAALAQKAVNAVLAEVEGPLRLAARGAALP